MPSTTTKTTPLSPFSRTNTSCPSLWCACRLSRCRGGIRGRRRRHDHFPRFSLCFSLCFSLHWFCFSFLFAIRAFSNSSRKSMFSKRHLLLTLFQYLLDIIPTPKIYANFRCTRNASPYAPSVFRRYTPALGCGCCGNGLACSCNAGSRKLST